MMPIWIAMSLLDLSQSDGEWGRIPHGHRAPLAWAVTHHRS
jgi:hypothetical protein